jgi:hypothetical protein
LWTFNQANSEGMRQMACRAALQQRMNQLMLESFERQTLTMSETADRSNGFKSSPFL